MKNPYARHLGKLYDKIPKEVLAAVAVSVLTHGGDLLGEVDPEKLVKDEWRCLFQNGIVTQEPPLESKADT